MAGISSESQFFSDNIANMIPEGPLNKIVPLTEDHGGGGGCMGTPVSSQTIIGLVMPYGDIELGQHWLRKWFVA